MSPNSGAQAERERRLDEVVTAYLKAAEAGEALDSAEWLARHPDLADDLAAFFAAEKQVRDLMPPPVGSQTWDAGEAPSAPPAPGSGHRFGDYELLEEIARGGMGVVYKARQRSL